MLLIIHLLVIYIIFFDISILDSIWGYDFLVPYVKGIFASAILLITLDKLKHIKFSDISVMMIIGGTILNYFYLSNTLNNHIGFILPWILVFLVPHLNINKIHLEKAWKYFYIIFLILTSFGLYDYYMIYVADGKLHYLTTQYGVFLKGMVSVLFPVGYDQAHHRFYGFFNECGNAAIFYSIFLVYSIIKRRVIGITIFGISLILTYSIGALPFLFFMLVLYWSYRAGKSTLQKTMLPILITSLLVIVFSKNIISAYEAKGGSRITREDNVINFVKNIDQVFLNPLGCAVSEHTDETVAENKVFTGNNFTVALYYNTAGVIGCIGYIMFLISLFKKVSYNLLSKSNSKLDLLLYFITLSQYVYIVQRAGLLETWFFAIMIYPAICAKNSMNG